MLNTRLTIKNKTHTVNVRLLDYSVQTTFINSFGSIILQTGDFQIINKAYSLMKNKSI